MSNSKIEFRGLMCDREQEANVLVYGVPFDCNCSISAGSKYAPAKLRELSWWLPPFSMDGKSLSHLRIFDKGDFSFERFEDLFTQAKGFFDSGKLPIIFGGDHSISIPFQKEFITQCKESGKAPVIVHIDAHCDICKEYMGSRFSHACTVRRAIENGLDDENLFMIGIREFEQDGYDYLINRSNGVHLYKASDVHRDGLAKWRQDMLRFNSDRYRIYVSFDIDSLDAAYAPGTGTPETCGLLPFQIKEILSTLGGFSNIDCLDLVEVAPSLDVNDITSWAAIKLLYEFLAELRLDK